MKTLKILYDYSPACRAEKTGIPIFTEALYDALNEIEHIDITKTVCISQYMPTRPWKLFRFVEQILYHNLYLPLKMNWGKYDIYIENNYMFIPFFKPRNTKIFTFIYDIGLVLFDDIQTQKHAENWRKQLPKSIKNTDVIITLSEASKKDIETYLRTLEEYHKPVEYIYANTPPLNMCNIDYHDLQKKFSLYDEYFLFIGTLEPRKNPLRVVQAFQLFKQNTKSKVKLVFAGKKGWLYEDVLTFVKEADLENEIIFTGYISEDEKACLLQHTKAFIFLSLYEGFGIPPLEALRMNVPTLLSDIDVFHELFTDNVRYADPYDIKNIATQLQKIQEHPKEIKQEKLEQFNWHRSAQKLLDFMQKYR